MIDVEIAVGSVWFESPTEVLDKYYIWDSGTEGGTHSAVRHALEAGVTTDEMEHVALLSITTIGLPAAGSRLTWIHDKDELRNGESDKHA
jgi:hypothetical protein